MYILLQFCLALTFTINIYCFTENQNTLHITGFNTGGGMFHHLDVVLVRFPLLIVVLLTLHWYHSPLYQRGFLLTSLTSE